MDNPWVLLLRGLGQAQFQERHEKKEQLKDNHVVRVSRPAKRHSAEDPEGSKKAGARTHLWWHSRSNTTQPLQPRQSRFPSCKKIQMIHSSAEISSSGDALSLGQHCSWKSPTHVQIYTYADMQIYTYICAMQIFCTSWSGREVE